MLYCDEMAYMNPQLFYKIIVPLLEVARTVLIAISTLVDVWNFFSVLLNLVDAEGEKVFLVYAQRLVCDRCMKRVDPEKCKHNYHVIPPWKSEAKLDMAKLIYGNDIVALKRESLGIVDGASGGIFDARTIKAMLERPRVDYHEFLPRTPAYVFISSDPSGGSDKCYMSLYATVRDMDSRVIVRLFVLCVCVCICTCRCFTWHRTLATARSRSAPGTVPGRASGRGRTCACTSPSCVGSSRQSTAA